MLKQLQVSKSKQESKKNKNKLEPLKNERQINKGSQVQHVFFSLKTDPKQHLLLLFYLYLRTHYRLPPLTPPRRCPCNSSLCKIPYQPSQLLANHCQKNPFPPNKNTKKERKKEEGNKWLIFQRQILFNCILKEAKKFLLPPQFDQRWICPSDIYFLSLTLPSST